MISPWNVCIRSDTDFSNPGGLFTVFLLAILVGRCSARDISRTNSALLWSAELLGFSTVGDWLSVLLRDEAEIIGYDEGHHSVLRMRQLLAS